MTGLKLGKKTQAQDSIPTNRAVRGVARPKVPAFPGNFLVVGSGDATGTWIVVVVFG